MAEQIKHPLDKLRVGTNDKQPHPLDGMGKGYAAPSLKNPTQSKEVNTVTDTLMSGMRNTESALAADALHAGLIDPSQFAAEVAENTQLNNRKAQSPDKLKLIEDVTDAEGFWETTGEVLKAPFTNPSGVGRFATEQVGNMLPSLSLGAAGAAAGSAVAPVIGTTAGFLAGMSAGTIGVETGHEVLSGLQELGVDTSDAAAIEAALTDDFLSEHLVRGLKRGGAIATVDLLTMGATKWMASAPSRALVSDLKKAGFNVASDDAIKAAMSSSHPKAVAALNKYSKARSFKNKAKFGAGGTALEVIGEPIGEAAAQVSVGDELDGTEIALEALGGLGASIATTGAIGALESAKEAKMQADKKKTGKPDTDKPKVDQDALDTVKVNQEKKAVRKAYKEASKATGLTVNELRETVGLSLQANNVPEEQFNEATLSQLKSITEGQNEVTDEQQAETKATQAENSEKGREETPRELSKLSDQELESELQATDNSAYKYDDIADEVDKRKKAKLKAKNQKLIDEKDLPESLKEQAGGVPVDDSEGTGLYTTEQQGLEPTEEDLAFETAPDDKDQPLADNKKATGKKATVYTSDNAPVEVEYDLVESDELVTSHDSEGRLNPSFPSSLQPRDRSSKKSQAQIQSIAKNLKPERLADSQNSQDGAPIVGSDNVVESGNGRVEAIRKAIAAGDETYKQYLKDNAKRLGIDPAKIDSMKTPVLVRKRATSMDDEQRAKFAADSNKSNVANMSALELAKADSAAINDELISAYSPNESGNVLSQSNNEFLQQFAKNIGSNDAAGLTSADGKWTKQMSDRVQSAVFHYSYGNDNLTNLLAEEADPDIKNVINALNKAAPAFARAKSKGAVGAGFDVSNSISEAADIILKAKESGATVKDVISQGGLFGNVEPLTAAIAKVFDANKRSSKRIAAFLNEVANGINQELDQSSNNDIFGREPQNLQNVVDNSAKPFGVENETAKETKQEPDSGNEQNNEQSDTGSEQAASEGAEAESDQGTTEVGRGEIGGSYAKGDQPITSSGRKTTPFPDLFNSKGGVKRNYEKLLDTWLVSNALEEAKSRGDDFNARTFESDLEEAGKLPPASKDSAELYLFGEQPDVVKPITKPLVESKPLKDIEITTEYDTGDGQIHEVTETADVIIKDFDTRLDALHELKACLR